MQINYYDDSESNVWKGSRGCILSNENFFCTVSTKAQKPILAHICYIHHVFNMEMFLYQQSNHNHDIYHQCDTYIIPMMTIYTNRRNIQNIKFSKHWEQKKKE